MKICVKTPTTSPGSPNIVKDLTTGLLASMLVGLSASTLLAVLVIIFSSQ